MERIRNIIFDCSDVLLRFGAIEKLREMAGSVKEGDRYWQALHTHPAWRDYDLGLVSTEEAHAALLHGFEGEQRMLVTRFIETWTDYYTEIPGMFALVRRLKAAGYKIYVLSDFPEVFENLRKRFAIFDEFDGLVVSYKIKLGKREGAEIFRYFCKEYGVEPGTCFFTDDTPRHVASAKSVGMHGCTFLSAEQLEEELHKVIEF